MAACEHGALGYPSQLAAQRAYARKYGRWPKATEVELCPLCNLWVIREG